MDNDHIQDQSIEKEEINELERIEKECEEYKAGWQRAQADYQNLQREVEQKRSEWVQLSEFQIIEEFLPVYDNLKKALSVQTDQHDTWREGIGFIMKQFGDVLKNHSVEEIETARKGFDPELHEAVGEEESDEEEGVIVREVETGYRIKERVLKAAKVIIAKKTG